MKILLVNLKKEKMEKESHVRIGIQNERLSRSGVILLTVLFDRKCLGHSIDPIVRQKVFYSTISNNKALVREDASLT